MALSALAPLGAATTVQPAEAPGSVWIEAHTAPSMATEVNRLLASSGIYASAISSGSDLESVFLSLTATAPSAAGAASRDAAVGWGERH